MTRDALRAEFLARLNAPPPPPLEALRDFLRATVADADTVEDTEAYLRRRAARNPRPLDHWIEAIEALLANPPAPGVLAMAVATDGNLGLPDETDAGAIPWLRDMGERIRRIRDEQAAPGN